MDGLRFFVLDEADRMVEKGHFKELQSIIDTLPKQGGAPLADSDPPAEDAVAETPQTKHVAQRQTFVFSATLMVPPSLKKKLKGAGKAPMRREQGQVAALIERAGAPCSFLSSFSLFAPASSFQTLSPALALASFAAGFDVVFGISQAPGGMATSSASSCTHSRL